MRERGREIVGRLTSEDNSDFLDELSTATSLSIAVTSNLYHVRHIESRDWAKAFNRRRYG
jgi:hypothetical protein